MGLNNVATLGVIVATFQRHIKSTSRRGYLRLRRFREVQNQRRDVENPRCDGREGVKINVATLKIHDVIETLKINVATLEIHVATFQRRVKLTSRRGNVVTLKRRDVSTQRCNVTEKASHKFHIK